MLNSISRISGLFVALIPFFVSGYWHMSPSIENESPVTDLTLDSSYPNSFSSPDNLKFSALGRDFHLSLIPADDIFAPNFKIFYSSKVNENGEILFEENSESSPLPGSFHSIKDGGRGALYVHRDANNRLHVEGTVDDDMRLIVEPSQSDSQLPFNHKMVQLSWHKLNGDPLTYDRVSQSTTTTRNRKEKVETMMQQQIVETTTKQQTVETTTKQQTVETTTKQQTVETTTKHPGVFIPQEVTVEVLVILDEALLTALKNSTQDVKKYLGIYWNSVQRLYDETRDPHIRFALVGVYKADARMINDSLYKPGHLNGHKLLNDFAEWLFKNKNQFPKFDLAVLQTNLDLASETEGKMHLGLLGRAYIGEVCNEDIHGKKLNKCAVGEDVAPFYSGVLTTAHEVGHLLGAPHDGSTTTKDCPPDQGYLMGESQNTERYWHFSPCSLTMIQNLMRSKRSACVRDKPAPKLKLTNTFPGRDIFSLNDVCRKWFGDLNSMYEPDKINCSVLWCQNSETKQIDNKGPPPEGTSCGENRVCLRGVCANEI